MNIQNYLILGIAGLVVVLLILKIFKNLFHTVFAVLGVAILLTAVLYSASLITGIDATGFIVARFKNFKIEDNKNFLLNKNLSIENIKISIGG